MRRLMLLRHAKTENDAPSGRDEDRRRAGPTAPAQGLFLMRVTYER